MGELFSSSPDTATPFVVSDELGWSKNPSSRSNSAFRVTGDAEIGVVSWGASSAISLFSLSALLRYKFTKLDACFLRRWF
jgi:hypothetical protein